MFNTPFALVDCTPKAELVGPKEEGCGGCGRPLEERAWVDVPRAVEDAMLLPA
jgi:hypothetical protein